MNQVIACDEVLARARGDERDGPELQLHLAACEPCRLAVAEFRQLARAARASLSPAPAGAGDAAALLASRALARARKSQETRHWLALAAVAGAAAALVMVPLRPGDPAPAPVHVAGQRSVHPSPFPIQPRLVLELRPAADDRLPYVVQDPAGVPIGHGELNLGNGYVMETVPANAVVVDTF